MAEALKLELVKQVAVEFLCQEFSETRKRKFAPDSVKQKLSRACRCSKTAHAGMHKDKCTLLPPHMPPLLYHNATRRASMESQLPTQIPRSPQQGEAALGYLFGPAVVILPGAEAGAE